MIRYHITPLKETILDGHTSFARHLIDRGVDVSARGKQISFENHLTLTSLQAIVDTNLEDIVKVLLIKEVDPNDELGGKYSFLFDLDDDDNHGTTLVRVAHVENIQIILALLKHGANLELCRSITSLQMTIKEENLSLAKLLLDKGAKDCIDWYFAALRLQDTVLFMKLLLDYGANVNFCPYQDPNSWQRYETTLAIAIRCSSLDDTRFLLDNDATLTNNSG